MELQEPNELIPSTEIAPTSPVANMLNVDPPLKAERKLMQEPSCMKSNTVTALPHREVDLKLMFEPKCKNVKTDKASPTVTLVKQEIEEPIRL